MQKALLPSIVLWGLALASGAALDTNSAPDPSDIGASARALVPALHAEWLREHDPVRRQELDQQLVDAVIHVYDQQPVEIADEVARNGAPLRLLSPPPKTISIGLQPLSLLTGAHRDEGNSPDIPVFRRLAADRVEAWIPKAGWLFDAKGQLLVQARVPRRDGTGRDWLGAFLPDGRWITTDLWENDQQLTCFDVQSDPRWGLPGAKLVTAVDAKIHSHDAADSPEPSIGWARADRTGKEWLVSVGTNYSRGFLLVAPNREVRALPADVKLWDEVYPRSMGVRGMFTELYIESDDAKDALHFSESGHGVGVGWPVYSSTHLAQIVINGGDSSFGFWPNSHAVYIETEQSEPEAHTVWFFDSRGKYQGQITGRFLSDAADGKSLLVQTDDGTVMTIRQGRQAPAVSQARKFCWPDGSRAVPLAFFDDLKLAFFLRGPDLVGTADDSRRARAGAEIGLASWK